MSVGKGIERINLTVPALVFRTQEYIVYKKKFTNEENWFRIKVMKTNIGQYLNTCVSLIQLVISFLHDSDGRWKLDLFLKYRKR